MDIFERYKKLISYLEEEKIRHRISEIESLSNSEEFWKNKERARELLLELSNLKEKLQEIDTIKKLHEEIMLLSELALEDTDFQKEYEIKLKLFEKKLNELEISTLLGNEDDKLDAILEIHPGAGGTESHDWAQMLMRMYLRWIEKKNFKYEILDIIPGEVVGIKSVSILVKGKYAYGLLRSEVGVHRLIRISPFDANSRRHTSFASVFVYPQKEDLRISINENDLKIETFRSSGAGGQHVNKTESAVRITHIPTGIVVTIRSERSQHKNKEIALKILKSKLYDYYKQQEEQKLKEIEEQKTDIAWGHQIRSYILHPYKLVKDHRTNFEHTNPDLVLDGEIDEFIRAYLLLKRNSI
ncbi:MAG: peptide chain release factor 2 [candidate division WOR-3 bacterium]|nr:peptide chain release factor 2 [candidate division WOR-3 bacterium]MCX7947824.1 peptide chain release factor 2 [candidate division WOR-3 bacterium]MDW8150781.1 peptide chain release factor 2 [candidate division WOR-3 bacterium]